MLTLFKRCIQVAFGSHAQRIESIGQKAGPATPSLGSIVYFWRQAGTNRVRKGYVFLPEPSEPICRTISGLPGGDSYPYAKRHNPLAYFYGRR
jgi:hypothetical protein